MQTFAKKTLVIFMVVVFVVTAFASSSFAQATIKDEEISTENMVADALIVRPLGIVATILGAGLFIVSLPFSALSRQFRRGRKRGHDTA